MTLNPWRTGFALGLFLGLWHLAWSMLVATGWAQSLLNFVLRIHFLQIAVSMAPFDLSLAVTLIAVTSLVGFLIGVIFAAIWNRLHRSGAMVRDAAHAR